MARQLGSVSNGRRRFAREDSVGQAERFLAAYASASGDGFVDNCSLLLPPVEVDPLAHGEGHKRDRLALSSATRRRCSRKNALAAPPEMSRPILKIPASARRRAPTGRSISRLRYEARN